MSWVIKVITADETGTMVGCVIASSYSAIVVFSSGAPIPRLLWGIGAITLIVCRWAGPFLRFLFPLAKIFFVGSASNFNQFPVPLFLVAFIYLFIAGAEVALAFQTSFTDKSIIIFK